MKGAQEEAVVKAVSRALRWDKPYDFKKKAHEEQAGFNNKAWYAVQEAEISDSVLDVLHTKSS